MAVVQPNDQLLEDPPAKHLWQAVVGLLQEVIPHGPPVGALHHNGEVVRGQEHLQTGMRQA